MNTLTYFSVFVFAVLPSFIWLLYFLREDKHPEPKSLLLLVFWAGACGAAITYLFQIVVFDLFSGIAQDSLPLGLFLLNHFLIISFSEEFVKYLAVFFTVRNNVELDEPVDIIIYMITAAMGFAVLENLIYLIVLAETITEVMSLSGIRFIGATLLHALASGILGLFLVCGYRFASKWFIVAGILVAVAIHGLYNIINAKVIEETISIYSVFLFLFVLLLILLLSIKKVKKMKSICSF